MGWIGIEEDKRTDYSLHIAVVTKEVPHGIPIHRILTCGCLGQLVDRTTTCIQTMGDISQKEMVTGRRPGSVTCLIKMAVRGDEKPVG